MKNTRIKIFIGTALLSLFLLACSDILDETPRATYTPEYFSTENGVMGGLTSMYAHLRYIFGMGYYDNSAVTGTDEATYGASADGNMKVMDFSVESLTSTAYPTSIIWNNVYSNINTASGIIENAAAVGISDALIAEARFFRAFDYFYLVQNYGGVPLDLGSGELKFNSTPSRSSVRNTVPEVYTKGIFPDLLTAVENLPETGRKTGTVTKTAARLFLAKAYLTYAWWLENPNGIPTYPLCDRTDPDGHVASWYYQEAYNVALEGINNPGSFSLQNSFYDVSVGTNDRNSEMVLYSDRTESSEYYGATSLTYASGECDQIYGWFLTWNYPNIRSSSTDPTSEAGWTAVSSVQREAEQHLGRPWVRMCPTIGAITKTFADKTYDSRYDGTFTTVYHGNWKKGGITNEYLYNANNMKVYNGDAILTFLNEDDADIVYPSVGVQGHNNVGAGELPGRADYVVGPSGISRIVFPGYWKLGPYRTDNGDGLGSPNAASTRPFPIAKFSELYFIAAEAAVQGATTSSGKSAYELINVIRARAGVWSYDNNGDSTKVEDHSAEMVAATPTTIDIDYILAERSREYFAEGYRWYDLARTQRWKEYSSTYQICSGSYGDHAATTVTRTYLTGDAENHLYLRPIPQGQLDGMEMTDEEKAAYQNPGY